MKVENGESICCYHNFQYFLPLQRRGPVPSPVLDFGPPIPPAKTRWFRGKTVSGRSGQTTPSIFVPLLCLPGGARADPSTRYPASPVVPSFVIMFIYLSLEREAFKAGRAAHYTDGEGDRNADVGKCFSCAFDRKPVSRDSPFQLLASFTSRSLPHPRQCWSINYWISNFKYARISTLRRVSSSGRRTHSILRQLAGRWWDVPGTSHLKAGAGRL